LFTGIVEELGRIEDRRDGAQSTRFRFGAPLVASDAGLGDSIAVNGCCLTVVALGKGWWEADAVMETLGRSNLAGVRVGDQVNLERSVRLADRLAGHLVQGHVDAVGEVLEPAPDLSVRAPASVLRSVVAKGSITVDGCSLTVVAVTDDSFRVAVIPHSAAITTFGLRRRGDAVNLEVDMIAKYVEKLLGGHAPAT
jgi:riboflavin synthase